MARKSIAALSVRVDGRPTPVQPRADAPPEVAEFFRNLTARCAPEHFRDADIDLIEQFAQAVLLARRAYDELAVAPVVDGKPSPWSPILERAHKSSAVLATKLRISPLGRIDPRAAHRNAGKVSALPVPWAPD